MSASVHPAPSRAVRLNLTLLDALIGAAWIREADREPVIRYARRRRTHVEEALLLMGLLAELQLLKFQANYYKTYFVSTRKLASAPIHDSLLRLVSHRIAEKLWIFPVKFEARTQELSVLTVQPNDLDVVKNVQFATRVPKVRALVARPAAIAAAIKMHYEGDSRAFDHVRHAGPAMAGPAAERERPGARGRESLAPSRGHRLSLSPADANGAGLPPLESGPLRAPHSRRPRARSPSRDVGAPGGGTASPPSLPPLGTSAPPAPASPPRPQVSEQPPAPSVPAVRSLPASKAVVPEAVAPQAAPQAAPETPSAPEVRAAVSCMPQGISLRDYLETMNVLVALLENERGELRTHSVTVARVCRRLCERLGLTQERTAPIVAAAYLHDIGKTSAYHLTPLNVSEYDTHREQAQKSYLAPVRIFESVKLPGHVNAILTHLYERFDGQGFPDRLSGKQICLGARVLAIVETYADLVGHTGNPFRSKLSSQEAWDVLAKLKGKIFDPDLVDVFKLVVLGDDLRAKLLAGSRRALLLDSDAEETTVLELRLAEHGFDVSIARNSLEAESALRGEYDVVVSEVDLKPIDGFELLQGARAGGNDTPWVFHSKSAEGENVHKGFELGAADFIAKPVSPDVVALKVSRVLDSARRSRRRTGVSGSLSEMALPDIVQVLFHGRKSGKLMIVTGSRRGEILFCDGLIFDASFGDLGREEAFYEMLQLRDGDFELDPNFRPTERRIQASPESLLLEGMRRMDEMER